MQRILIVDDSVAFRNQVAEALRNVPDIEIVGAVANGKLALARLLESPVDIAIVDLEMPEMNGLELLEAITLHKILVKTIFFASQTKSSALSSLKALNRGAFDFVIKPKADLDESKPRISIAESIRQVLLPKIKIGEFTKPSVVEIKNVPPAFDLINWQIFVPKAIVIGSSTGGPTALEKLFDRFGSVPICPIFIAQHMPPIFTAMLSERLSAISGLRVAEGVDGEVVTANRIYVAPGNFHMTLKTENNIVKIVLDQHEQRHSVRPAVDHLFESAAQIYKNYLLGVILTGMGEDGRDGAVAIKKAHGAMIIQNQASCVVYGMPRAVYNSGAYDRQTDLEGIKDVLQRYSDLGRLSLRKAT